MERFVPMDEDIDDWTQSSLSNGSFLSQSKIDQDQSKNSQ
jgi:hypothetical protein